MIIVYALTASDLPGVIRYVGKTSSSLDARVKGHVYDAVKHPKNTHKENWIRDVLANGHQIEGVAIAGAVTDEGGYLLEQYYTEVFKALGFQLTNASDKGPGCAGYKHTSEAIEYLRKVHSGRKHTDETKAKMSLAKKGKPISDVHKQHIGEAVKGRVVSEETRKKHSDANNARSEEQQAKQRELARTVGQSNKGRIRSEEERAKQSLSSKGKPHSESHRLAAIEGRRKAMELRKAKALGGVQ